jgi:hypothetical protein
MTKVYIYLSFSVVVNSPYPSTTMTKHYAFAISFIFVCSILFYSCGSNRQDSSEASSTKTATSGKPDLCLSSLSINGAAFAAYVPNKGNVILNYFLTDTCVTLRGWILQKGSKGSGNARKDTGTYNPSKVLMFDIKPIKCLSVGTQTVISNQVILGKYVDKILDYIKRYPSATLHFKPIYTPSNGSVAGSVSYSIEVYAATAEKPEIMLLLETFTTNPAPPHQAFD